MNCWLRCYAIIKTNIIQIFFIQDQSTANFRLRGTRRPNLINCQTRLNLCAYSVWQFPNSCYHEIINWIWPQLPNPLARDALAQIFVLQHELGPAVSRERCWISKVMGCQTSCIRVKGLCEGWLRSRTITVAARPQCFRSAAALFIRQGQNKHFSTQEWVPRNERHSIYYFLMVIVLAMAAVANGARGGMQVTANGGCRQHPWCWSLFASSMADQSIKQSGQFWPISGN